MSILKNVLQFTGLAINVPASLPHLLNVNGRAIIPQYLSVSSGGFIIGADATNVTVTRTTGAAFVDVYAERWHSFEDTEPPGGILLLPFVAGGNSAPIAVPSVSFVFQPGGVANANVYTDWPTLMAAVGLVSGLKIITIDDTFVSPAVIPAGTWDLTGCVLSGVLFRPVFATMGEGVVLLNARQFDAQLILQFTGTTAPIQDMANGEILIAERGVEFSSTVAPMISLSALTPGQSTQIVLRDGSRFVNAGSPVLDVPVVGTSAVILALGAFSEVNSNTVSGVAGSTILIGGTVNAPFGLASVDQPAFLGTVQFVAVPGRFNVDGTIQTGNTNAGVGVVTRLDPTGGAFNVTLPPAFNNSGQSVILKNVSASANVITILPFAGDTVDGGASTTIAAARGSLTFVSDGILDWMIIQ